MYHLLRYTGGLSSWSAVYIFIWYEKVACVCTICRGILADLVHGQLCTYLFGVKKLHVCVPSVEVYWRT